MFVYPIVYFFIWLFPFINHLTQYSNDFAQHPVYALTILTWISIASMGMVDSLIFSIREKPWRHIPGSDGTFWGSFKFWKQHTGASGRGNEKRSPSSPTGAAQRRSQASTVSGSTRYSASAPVDRKASTWSWLRWPTFLGSTGAAGAADDYNDEDEDEDEEGEHRASSNAPIVSPQQQRHAPLSPRTATTATTSRHVRSATTTTTASSTLDAMHTWDFARDEPESEPSPKSERQEAYWFDRRLSLALGRTGLEAGEQGSAREDVSERDWEGRGRYAGRGGGMDTN